MGQRTAVAGLIVGSLFVILFWRQAGMSVAYTIAFFAFFMGVSVAITRIRAELGFPMHDLHFAGPSLLMVHSLGTRPIGARNLTVSSLLYFITRNHNGHVMPHQLEGFKLSQRVGMGNRRLLGAMLLATVVGTLAAFWAMLDLFYREGAGTPHGAGIEPMRRLQTWMSFSHTPDHGATVHITGGLLLGLILMMMRTRFVWWPLHPAGYAVASSYGMRENVTSLFLSWGIKYAVIRFGGLTLHRKFTLVFLGVILGEFTMGSIWTIIGAVYNAKVYDFTSWY